MSDSISTNNNGANETSAPSTNHHEPAHDRRADVNRSELNRAEVNRENAAHSTGPRTAAGKQRSSLNALRHGLTGHVIVLPSEDHAAYGTPHPPLLRRPPTQGRAPERKGRGAHR